MGNCSRSQTYLFQNTLRYFAQQPTQRQQQVLKSMPQQKQAEFQSLRQQPEKKPSLSQRLNNLEDVNKEAIDQYKQEAVQEMMDEMLLDVTVTNEKIRLFFKNGQKDIEMFDQIIHQIQMYAMEQGGIEGLEVFDNIIEITTLFKKRAENLEFATGKYAIYLQYAAVVLRESPLIDSLLRHGFDYMYDKMSWADKIIAVEIVSMMEVDYTEKILDKLSCEILYLDHEELLENLTTDDFLHLMTIYNQYNYKRLELWNKFEILLVQSYELGIEMKQKEGDGEGFLDHQMIMIALKIITDKKISNQSFMECLASDIEVRMNKNEFDLKDFLTILDSYYKLLYTDESHLQAIANYLLSLNIDVESFEEFKTNEILRFFRGLFQANHLSAQNFAPLFQIYIKLLEQRENELNLSTLLTVIETCRGSHDQMEQYTELYKKKYLEKYDPTMFETTSDSQGLTEGSTRRGSRNSRPRSVLLNKRDREI
eukprot:403351044